MNWVLRSMRRLKKILPNKQENKAISGLEIDIDKSPRGWINSTVYKIE